MATSVFDIFTIGIGPSSSHTVGPMRAASTFAGRLEQEGLLARTARIRSDLFGSLGATGKGHGSDKAVLLGLEGAEPEQIDPDTIDLRLAQIRDSSSLRLLGVHDISFRERKDIIFHRRKSLPFHPNGSYFIKSRKAHTVWVVR